MLLTIAIPSHNATHYLHQALTSITSQPEFGLCVDICISDNSKSNDTYALISSFYKNFESIHYHRSTDCPTLDANVNRVLELSNGTYVWVFGDDDLLEPGILTKLLLFLKTRQPDLVVLNSSSFCLNSVIESSRVAPGVQSCYGPEDDNAFLRDFGGYLTYIGAILVRKKLWLQYYDTSKVGSYFAHIYALMSLKHGRTVYYYPHPSIKMRMHSQTWKDKAFEIWHCFLPDLIWNLPGYSNEAKSSVIPRYPMNSPRRMLAARAYGRLNARVWFKLVLNARDASYLSKAFILLICLLPQSWLVSLYRFVIIKWRNRQTLAFSPSLALAQLPNIR